MQKYELIPAFFFFVGLVMAGSTRALKIWTSAMQKRELIPALFGFVGLVTAGSTRAPQNETSAMQKYELTPALFCFVGHVMAGPTRAPQNLDLRHAEMRSNSCTFLLRWTRHGWLDSRLQKSGPPPCRDTT